MKIDVLFEHRVDVCPLNVLAQTKATATTPQKEMDVSNINTEISCCVVYVVARDAGLVHLKSLRNHEIGYKCHWGASFLEDVPLVEFMYLVFIRMPGES